MVGTRLAGHARVLSGDTIVVNGRRITLHGLATPLVGQACYQGPTNWNCGDAAGQALENLVARGPVVCIVLADTTAGAIGTCKLGRDDLAAAMVETGLAKSALPSLRAALEDARADQRGLWVGPIR
jgi:endonuclease YncB( thermonuclease family)